MARWSSRLCLLLVGVNSPLFAGETTVDSVETLVEAVNNGQPGDVIIVEPGVYELASPLRPVSGMVIRGACADETVIRNAPSWLVGVDGLPDNGVDQNTVVQDAYLFNLGNGAVDVEIAELTLTGPELHGAVYCNDCDGLILRDLVVDDFLWSSVRIFRVNDGVIYDNRFIDAGGRASITSGPTGGAIYATFTNTTDIFNNRFTKTTDHPGNFFGIKGRKATDTRIFNNTINVSFSIELPFENDARVEIFNNDLRGVVSIPKFAGGPPNEAGQAFHIHHNYFTRTYSIEGPRNGLEVDHNLFDFDTNDDGGNLIAAFGTVQSPVAPGPTLFHNNLVSNPGRGVLWSAPIYNQVQISNNHIIANPTVTPRTEGLLGFRLTANADGDEPDLASLVIRDNIVEFVDLARPLIRNGGGVDISPITVENNTLINVLDAEAYENPDTGAPRGPLTPLLFTVGVHGESIVDGFTFIEGDSPIAGCPACPADIDGNGVVGPADLAALLGAWDSTDESADLNEDGQVDAADLATLLGAWGACDAP